LPEAIATAQRSLEILTRVLPADHPSPTYPQVYLANMYRDAGEPARSRTLLEAALTVRARVFGDDSPQVLEVVIELGRISAMQGRREEARAHYERALRIADQGAGTADELSTIRAELASVRDG
ncbi:MAG: tetratricopeptide repeat protein, partial [bacterium]|nr:tetratricopeptide repeat protein [bacterium]